MFCPREVRQIFGNIFYEFQNAMYYRNLNWLIYQKNWPFTSENCYTIRPTAVKCWIWCCFEFDPPRCLNLARYLICQALRMETVNTSETPVNFYLTIRYHIPENNAFLFHMQNPECDDNGVTWWSDYRRVLDWWSDLLDTLIQRVTTLTGHTLVTSVTSSLDVAW
jgi:hypothetical protein